jgi:tripeptide aminopeptidase
MDITNNINRERLTETFIELIRINSPSYEEAKLGEVLIRKLSALGCETVTQDYGKSFNVIAGLKGTMPKVQPLLLCAHMDTIEPTEGMSFALESDRIRCTGDTVLGADDKSALAQIIEALTVIRECGIPHGDIEIVFTSAEEKGLNGSSNLDFSKLKSHYALVPDSGGSVGSLVTAAPTHLTYEMRIAGRAAHAGIEPENGINAIRVAAGIIGLVPDGRIDPLTTANIGIIKGGTATNVVAKETVINGEIRGHDTNKIEEIRHKIFDTAGTVAGQYGADLNISVVKEYSAYRIEEGDDFLRFLSGVYNKCGIEPVFKTTGGGSDANVLNSRGIKAINISNGMQRVHSSEEFILLQDLYDGCRVVLTAAAEFPEFSGMARR